MNDINKLRTHLFSTLDGLANGSIDIEKAKAISEVGRTIIQTAQVEVNYMRAGGQINRSEFIAPDAPKLPTGCTSPGPGRLAHKIR